MAIVIKKNETADGELMNEVKELYFGNATLYLDPDEKEDFESSKPDFLKFLEQDQRYLLKEINSPVEKSKRMIKFLTECRDKRYEQMKLERDLEYNNSRQSTEKDKNVEEAQVERISQRKN